MSRFSRIGVGQVTMDVPIGGEGVCRQNQSNGEQTCLVFPFG